jgi:hypothetical protein
MLRVAVHAGKSRAERPEYIAPVVCEQILRKPSKLAHDAADVLVTRCRVGRVRDLRWRGLVTVLVIENPSGGRAQVHMRSGRKRATSGRSQRGATCW